MTVLWNSCLLISLLMIFKSVHCVTDSANSFDDQNFRTPTQDNQQSEIERPVYTYEDDDLLQNVLNMASKRFDGQTFFPVRGKKQLPGDSGPVGFHSARGRRSLADLSRLFYYDNDYPILQRLYPEITRLPPVYRGGHKRLDSFSFYGVRGKRPNGWENRFWMGKSDSGDRLKSYLSESKISESSQEGQSLKRQPPPGFYGLRG
ncbi:uncharacterized protein LOC135461791 [Liolophura sinensis]|uniref:uncharacterized protein LOC135461791 n=1 Tax=Liolophura sinensis TaxID=3198878 RepID=UPI0031580685